MPIYLAALIYVGDAGALELGPALAKLRLHMRCPVPLRLVQEFNIAAALGKVSVVRPKQVQRSHRRRDPGCLSHPCFSTPPSPPLLPEINQRSCRV